MANKNQKLSQQIGSSGKIPTNQISLSTGFPTSQRGSFTFGSSPSFGKGLPRTAFLTKPKFHEKSNKNHNVIDAIMQKLHSDRSDVSEDQSSSNNLLKGYTEEELLEYRQVFSMFDTDHSGSIAIDELEAAIKNLGLEQTRDDLSRIIDEVDQRGNHQIDFDEFCVVMRRLTIKKTTWNEIIRECFTVFNRSENGGVTKRDFQHILRELGDITDSQIINEIFNEADVDGDGVIDYDEFTYMVKNYLTDDDI